MAATASLQIIIGAKDQSTSVLKKVKNSLGDISKPPAFKLIQTGAKAAATGVGILAAGASAFGVVSFNAFKESEAAMTRFNSTLATTGKAGIAAREQLLKAADAATKLGFDDEDAAESLAKFYQRTKSVTESLKLQNVAMDLARAKNIDLASASQMVNMVLSGNGKALKEYGIVLKEGQSPIKALAELQKLVAGQSENYAHTTAGNMERLEVAFGNFKEEIGGALATVIVPFLETMNDFAQSEAFKAGIERMTDVIRGIPAAFTEARERVKGFFDDTNATWVFLRDTFGPSFSALRDAFVDGWAEITAAFQPIKPELEWLGKILGSSLVGAIIVLTASLVAFLSLGIQTIAAIVRAFSDGVVYLRELFTAFFLYIMGKNDLAVESFKNAWSNLRGFFSGLLDSIVDMFYHGTRPIIDLVNKIISGYNNIAGKVGKKTISEIRIGGRATGGSVMPGKAYMVGERGPELFVPSLGGRIEKSSTTNHSEAVYNFHFEGAFIGDKEELMREIIAVINRKQELARLGA